MRLAALALLVSALGIPVSPTPTATPCVTPDTAANQRWQAFGDKAKAGQWAAADGTYSTPLPDGRTAWLYNDTFVGPVGPGPSVPEQLPVHNTIVPTVPGSSRPAGTVFGAGSTTANPLPIAGPPGTDQPWYWNADGIVDNGKLWIFEAQQRLTGDGHFGFEWIGTDLAVLSLPDLKLQRIVPTYDSADITWGVELVPVGNKIYIYGVRQNVAKDAYLARADRGHLDGSWQFYTGTGWSSREADATAIAGDVGSSYGVAKVNGQYVLVTTDSFLGSKIFLLSSPTPWGFATAARTQIYDTPEGQPAYDQNLVGDVYTYNIAAHPSISAPGTLEISYNVNDTDLDELLSNVTLNRARFLTVNFSGKC